VEKTTITGPGGSGPSGHPAEDFPPFRLILDQVGACIFTKDPEGRYTYANRRVADLFACPLSEILGSTDEQFFDLSEYDSLRKNDLRVLRHGEQFEGEETHVVASTGETRITWSVKRPLRNADGTIIGLCGISTDVTGLKESEEQARISSVFYQALFETTRILHQPADLPPEEILLELSRTLFDLLSPSLIFLGQRPAGRTEVEVLTFLGPFQEWMDGVVLSSDAAHPGGRGPAGEALRTGLPQAWLLSDPRTPAVMKERGPAFGITGNLSVTSSRKGGETVLLSAFFPGKFLISSKMAELFQRIATEVSEFLDRKRDRAGAIRLEHACEAHRLVLKDLFSAKTEEEVCRILSVVVSRETEAMAVEVMISEGDRLVRCSLEGPLADIVRSLPDPPMTLPEEGSPVPLPARVWDARRMVIVKNPATDPRLPDLYRTPLFEEIGLAAGFPLSGRSPEDPLLGVVILLTHCSDAFDDPLVIDVVTDIVDTAAHALERLRTEKSLTRETSLYTALSAINNLVLRKPGEEELLLETIEILISLGGFIATGFYFPDDQKHLLELKIYKIMDDTGDFGRYPMTFSLDPSSPDATQSVAVRCFLTGTPAVINDLQSHYGEAGALKRLDDYRILSFRSTGIYPVVRNGNCTGVFAFVSAEKGFFTPDISSLLSETTRILSMALDGIDTEQKRQESEERLATLIETLPEAIFFKDGEGRWKAVNQAGLRLFGLEGTTGWVDKTDRELGDLQPDLAPLYAGCTLSDNAAWSAGGASNGIETLADPDGNSVILDTIKIPLFHSDGTRKGLVISSQDITERKRNEVRIEHLANHDPLTDLPNRRVFLDRIGQTLLRSGRSRVRFAIGILDLDGFKGVNDRLGHPAGDELLVQVAKRLEVLLRRTDTLARLGGDEFGLLLTDLEEGVAYEDLFTKIVESLLDPFAVDNGIKEEVSISGSLGLALCPPDHGDVTALIAHADLALYQVKDHGRNGWAVFESGMEESLLEQHRILTEFGGALRNGELRLYYQPQVNMKTGQVIGVEALVRWNHPERGVLLPADFIEVVEKSSLIDPLGLWILRTAMAQQEEWDRQGLDLRVSVNIGARHFLSDGFIGTLTDVLSNHERSEHLVIKIEVTETEALADLVKARQVVECCHVLGVPVSLDDFGTGQASLTSLQQLDVKEVKIDLGFIRRMMDSPKDLAIVSSLATAARMMLIDVVAEGVETEEHGALLLRMGCRIAQGYAIARPMVSERIPAWVREWRPFESWIQPSSGEKAGSQDDTLLMVGQAMKVFMKGLLSGLDIPGAIKEEWTDPNKCILCRWIEHAGRSWYGGTPEFDSLAGGHAAFHVQVCEALLARDRKDTEALERLKSEFTESSLALQEALQKLSN